MYHPWIQKGAFDLQNGCFYDGWMLRRDWCTCIIFQIPWSCIFWGGVVLWWRQERLWRMPCSLHSAPFHIITHPSRCMVLPAFHCLQSFFVYNLVAMFTSCDMTSVRRSTSKKKNKRNRIIRRSLKAYFIGAEPYVVQIVMISEKDLPTTLPTIPTPWTRIFHRENESLNASTVYKTNTCDWFALKVLCDINVE